MQYRTPYPNVWLWQCLVQHGRLIRYVQSQVTAQKEHLTQSTDYSKSSGGAAKDNTVGWSMSNAQGYNPAEKVTCAVGLTQCHYTPACNDLQSSAQYCGSCDLSCDFYTQVIHMLMLEQDMSGCGTTRRSDATQCKAPLYIQHLGFTSSGSRLEA